MNSHHIEHIIHKHLKHLNWDAEDITDTFDEDAIHDFRVGAKKIRSFLRLMATQNDNFPTGYYGKFRKVYHTAGFLRDKQLLKGELKKQHENAPAFKLWLKDQIKEHKKEWKKLPVKKALKSLTDELMDLPFEGLKKQTLLNFFSAGIDAINRIMSKDLISDEELHEVRKKLKDLMYIAALCEKEWKEGNKLIQVFSPNKIVDLSALIGTYNDQRIALDILEDFRYSGTLSDKKDTEQLQQRWLNEKKEEKKKLLIALHDFING